MNEEQKAQFIGMLYDWKEGKTELISLIEYLDRVIYKSGEQ